MKIAAATLLFFTVALFMLVTSGDARSLRKEIEEDEAKLVQDEIKLIKRLKRHQADTLFNHYRRKNKVNMMRKVYLNQLLRRINKRSIDDYDFSKSDVESLLEILSDFEY